MKPRIFPYTLTALMLIVASTNQIAQKSMDKEFDWQGHRGARGLLPENSIPAFLKALEFPVTTLELDVAISKDKKVIISHEPWMSHHICSHPDGRAVTKEESKSLKIYEMTYEEIKKFNCGSRGNERFPEQLPMDVSKPTLSELVGEVKDYCFMRKLPMPKFNIEIKSEPKYYDNLTPPPAEFVEILIKEIEELGLSQQVTIQSFDVRPLQVLNEKGSKIPLVLLVENLDSPKKNLDSLGFTPYAYSPYYKLLKKKHIKALHAQNIKVVPWTVNNIKAMKKLRRKGVDGIITDYPNLIEEVLK